MIGGSLFEDLTDRQIDVLWQTSTQAQARLVDSSWHTQLPAYAGSCPSRMALAVAAQREREAPRADGFCRCHGPWWRGCTHLWSFAGRSYREGVELFLPVGASTSCPESPSCRDVVLSRSRAPPWSKSNAHRTAAALNLACRTLEKSERVRYPCRTRITRTRALVSQVSTVHQQKGELRRQRCTRVRSCLGGKEKTYHERRVQSLQSPQPALFVPLLAPIHHAAPLSPSVCMHPAALHYFPYRRRSSQGSRPDQVIMIPVSLLLAPASPPPSPTSAGAQCQPHARDLVIALRRLVGSPGVHGRIQNGPR
ncbi:hypothetical protein PYCCODRAFT_371872 [Trametes coccinea BRFM310]|uniref:Uncharacterized protein n=1 Tax=Trametes coccinea (strain BRFM310) TaxID=1353009 RepID=A0A1Y2J3K5_TRAC3|nr:hypothetical protein PYCCODRAFT_371872 [Trametes coccinea BRFM310]